MQTKTSASQVSPTIARCSGRGPRTRRGLPAGAALLVGRLILTAAPRRPPVLTVAVWCCYCRTEHRHGLPEVPARLDEVGHRAAHCFADDSPLRNGGYWIGLDPARAVEHRKTLAEFARLTEAAR